MVYKLFPALTWILCATKNTALASNPDASQTIGFALKLGFVLTQAKVAILGQPGFEPETDGL